MESLLIQSIVQGTGAASCDWAGACSFLEWTFWIGVAVGVIGGIVSFFKSPIEGL